MTTLSPAVLEEHNKSSQQPVVARKLGALLSQPNLSQQKTDHKSESGSSNIAPMNNSGGGGTKGAGGGLAGLLMMKRKMRTWKKTGGAGSTMGSSVRSGPKLALENSYRMEPHDNETFSEEKVKKVMEESIKLFMGKQTGYNPAKSSQVSRYLSEDIKTRVKQLNFKRYKFVVHVMIGQSKEQGMQYATRCVWDTDNDNVATVTYRHKDIFIVANVFATYFE